MPLRFLACSVLIHALFVAMILELAGDHAWHARTDAMGIEILEHLIGPTLPAKVTEKKKATRERSENAPQAREAAPAPGVESIADRPQESRPSELAPSGEGSSRGSQGDPYLTELIRLLETNRIYPASSIRREEEGRVLLSVTVDADGTLSDLRVQEPAAFDNLNRAALETLRKIGKFPAPPDRFSTPLHIRIPLAFRIERR